MFTTTGGLHSYRFVEVLSFGCIPVVLSDDWVVPFEELAPLSSYGIRVNERDWETLPTLLRAIPTPEVNKLQSAVVAAYEQVITLPSGVVCP